MKNPLTLIRSHPFASGALVIAAAIGIYTALPRTTYSTVAEAEVLEEKLISTEDFDSDKGHYLLHLAVAEEKGETFYTLHVKSNPEMPIEVLDELIDTGTKIIIPYLKTIGKKGPLYDLTRFGTIDSAVIKVIRPWESSEEVMEEHKEKIERQRRLEKINRDREMAGYTRSHLF